MEKFFFPWKDQPSTQYGNLRLEATVHQCPECDPQEAHCHLVISIQLGGTGWLLLGQGEKSVSMVFSKGAIYLFIYLFIYIYNMI